MFKQHFGNLHFSLAIVLIALSFCSPIHAQTSKAQAKQISALIKQIRKINQPDAFGEYTHKLRIAGKQIDQNNKEKSFSYFYETFLPTQMPKTRLARLPLILIERDGRQFEASEIEVQQKNAAQILAEVDRSAPVNQKKAPFISTADKNGYYTFVFQPDGASSFGGGNFVINISQFLKGGEFSNQRQIQFEGRETILLDFRARPKFKFDEEMKYFSKLEGTVWIDSADKRVIRLEGFPLGQLVSPSLDNQNERETQAAVLYNQIRVSDGFWFPQKARLNGIRNPEIFEKTVGFELEMIFSDYQRFQAQPAATGSLAAF